LSLRDSGSTFGIDRQPTGYVLMLEVRLKSGTSFGLPYSFLIEAGFDASGVLTLVFTTRKVTIKGRNLRIVYDFALNHRLEFVQEENPLYDESSEAEPFISSIEVEPV